MRGIVRPARPHTRHTTAVGHWLESTGLSRPFFGETFDIPAVPTSGTDPKPVERPDKTFESTMGHGTARGRSEQTTGDLIAIVAPIPSQVPPDMGLLGF